MSESKKILLTKRQLASRTGRILADCAQSCICLQDALSPLMEKEQNIAIETAAQIQALDRISQILVDLSKVFDQCSHFFGEDPAIFEITLANCARMREMRDKLCGLDVVQKINNDVELF